MPLSSDVCTVLWRYIRTVRNKWQPDSPYIFVGRQGTGTAPLEPHTVSYRFALRARQVLVAAFAFMTFAIRPLRGRFARACPKERVRGMLGHSSDAVTSIYEHLDFEDVAASHREAGPLRLLA